MPVIDRVRVLYIWISHTEAALEKAPNYIKELIQRVPEHERYRFGNGGQLVSRERVRLPFVVAGKVILVWVSSVPCASLGLLLGKDALDALGSLLDFMGNRIQFQLLSPQKWIPLHKLSAGHFAIPCLPTPLTRWPSLSSQPWVRVCKGSCCEVQVESKQQWILKKLRTTFSQSCTSEPESQVVEHFVSASFLDLSLEALGDHASRATEMAASRQSAAAFASGLSLESHVHPPCSPSSMALARPAPVADSTALFEVCAVSSSFSDDGAGMASAGGLHGGTRFMASSMAGPHQHRDPMHSRAFERGHPPSRSHGTPPVLPGGRDDHVRPEGLAEEASQADPRSSGNGGPEIAQPEQAGARHAATRLAGAKRRLAAAQGRIAEGCCFAQYTPVSDCHRGRDSEALAAYRQRLDCQAKLGGSRCAQVLASSSESEGQTVRSSSNNSTTSGDQSGFTGCGRGLFDDFKIYQTSV